MRAPAEDWFAAASAVEGVPSALAAARDAVDVLLQDRGRRRTTPSHTAEALLRGAVASARMAGSGSSGEEVRAGTGDPAAVGALRLNAGLLALSPVLARSPLEALARMHVLAAAGLLPAERLGKPRPDPAASALLRRLADRLLAPTAAPALAVAALAHAEIVAGAPFEAGSDLVGRALERLVLVSRGVDPASVLVPEAGHLEMADRYHAALLRYGDSGAAGAIGWLRYACDALTVSLAESPIAAAAS